MDGILSTNPSDSHMGHWFHRRTKLKLTGLLLVCAFGNGCEQSGRPAADAVSELVPRVRLGMTQSQVEAKRNNARDNSGLLIETVGSNQSILYWFGRHYPAAGIPPSELAVVAFSAQFELADTSAILAAADSSAKRWSARYGVPDSIPSRSIRREGTVVRLHARIWRTDEAYFILSHEVPDPSHQPPRTLEMNRIVQDLRLSPETSLPDS